MTENTRLRLGAYFLFALLLLTLPVTLLVTHLDTVRHAQQWKATPNGVQLANANYRPQAVQWAKKTFGLSAAGAEKYVRDNEKRTKTTLDLGESVPYGATLDYYTVDGTKIPQTAKLDGSAVVAAAASPAATEYMRYVKGLPAAKKSPDFLDTLSASLKKGYVAIPTAFGQPAAAGKRGAAPRPNGAKAGTTNMRIAVIFTKLPGLRDISPRGDGDTDANDTANLFINYNTGASNPVGTPTEVCYKQATDVPENPVGQLYNWATTTAGGRDEPFWTAPNDLGSIFDSPGGPFSTGATWGVPVGIPGGWDFTDEQRKPHATHATNLLLQNSMYDLFFNPSYSVTSVNNFFYQQTHGAIKIDGTTNDIVGWLTSAHQLNRYPYQGGGGNSLFIHPGTPVIRSGMPGQLSPATGCDPSANQIMRATLSSRGLTILFSHPVYIPPNPAGTVNINAYTSADVSEGAATAGGPVDIVWAQSTYSVVMDPYDARRWTIANPGGTGWKFMQSDDTSAPSPTYVSFVSADNGAWSLTGSHGGYAKLANWQRGQMQGCAQLDNTAIEASDLHISLYDNSELSYAAPAKSVPLPNRPFARLKTEEWYILSFVPSMTYQITHLRNEWGRDDDISGTVVPGGDSYRADRVYPYDHESDDPWNGGYWAIGGAVRNGSSGAYVGDVNNVMLDNGIALSGYQRTIYIAADGGPSAPGGGDGDTLGGFQPSSGLGDFNESGAGVSFHELAHTFGAGDLYDNDLYANHAVPPPVPAYHECAAMGPYSLMDAGGRLDAYHLLGMGYAVPQVITQDTLGVQIPEIEGLLRDPVILKIPGNPYYLKKNIAHTDWKEYFLVENRNVNAGDGNGAYGFDSSTKGMYIYHIDTRGMARNNPNQAGGQREDDLMSIIIEQSDGLHELEFNNKGNAGTVLTDPFGGNVATRVSRFWQFPMFTGDINDSGLPVNVLSTIGSPTSYSHGMTNPERTGNSQNVIVPGTETDSFARIINISNIGQTMTADVFVEPAELRVTGSSLTTGTVRQGDDDTPIMKLTMANRFDAPGKDMSKMSTKDVYLDTMRILESGTSTDGYNLSAVKLYADANANGTFEKPGTLPTADALLATTTVNTTPGDRWQDYATFTGLGYRIAKGMTQTLFIAYDIAPEAQTNPFITVGAEFTDASKILPRVPGTVEVRQRNDANPTTDGAADANAGAPLNGADPFNFGSFMFPVFSNTSVIHNFPDRLVVTQPSPYSLPSDATPGQTNVPLLRLRLETNKTPGSQRTEGYVRVANLQVQSESATGFSAPSELVNAALWDDLNRNGIIDVSTDAKLAQSSFTSDSGRELASFINLNLQVLAGAANAKELIVAANIAPGATVGRNFTFSVKFPTPGDWASGNQTNCDIQLMNSTTELAANKDYVEFSGADFTFPSASPLTTIISPNKAPNRVTTGFLPTGIIFNQSPTLQWDAATDDDPLDTSDTLSYKIDLSTDGTFSNIIRTIDTTLPNTTTWAVPAPVLNAGTYYWRVRTRDSHGAYSVQWSETQQFTVQLNAPPNRVTTAFDPQNISVTTLTPQITWGKTTDPNPGDPQNTLIYKLQIDDNADFSSLNVDWTGVPDGNVFNVADWSGGSVLSPLSWGVQYYWRVQALDDQAAASAWTNEAPGAITLWFRTVQDRSPNAPIAAFVPSGSEEVATGNPVLTWNMPGTPDPDPTDTLANIHYEVQLDDSADLANVVPGSFAYEISTAVNTLTATVKKPPLNLPATRLTDNTQYYYRVRAVDDEGAVSPWTSIQDFWVNTANNAPTPPNKGFDPVTGATVSTATPVLSWDNSLDPDVDPYDGAFTSGVAPTQIVGVNWTIQLTSTVSAPNVPDFTAVAYTYTVPARVAAGNPTFTVPVGLTQGIWWYWRVKATDNNGAPSAWSTAPRFKVNAAANAPTAPNSGFVPAAGSNVSSLTPLLQWNAGTDIDAADDSLHLRYEVQVAEDIAFATGPGYFWSGGPTANGTQTIPVGLALTEGKTYYWRVRTVDTTNLRSAWAAGMNFGVVANRAPNNVTSGFYPAGLLAVSDTTPDLTWNAATPPDPDADDTADTISYQVEVDNNNTFNSPEFSGNAAMPHADALRPVVSVTSPLSVGVTYYWRVRPMDKKLLTAGVAGWSTRQSFRIVANQAPYVPVAPFDPADGAEVSDATPRLSWTTATPPDPNVSDTAATISYEIQLNDAADLSSGPYDFSATLPAGQTFADVSAALQDNVHYYYRIRAKDVGGLYSPWTVAQHFYCNTINNPPVAPTTGFDPVSGSTTANARPTLSWDNSADPDPDPFDGNVTAGAVVGVTFTVELSRKANFVPVAYTYNTAAGVSTLTPTIDLTDATVWYWRVKTVDNDGAASVFSTTQSLTVDSSKTAPNAPASGFAPAGGASVSSLVPQLTWNAGSDSDTGQGPETLRYQVQVAEDLAFATTPGYYWQSGLSPVAQTNVTIPAAPALVMGKTYYWRVRTIDPTALYSVWSGVQMFVVGANRAPNAIVAGFAPSGGTTVADTTPLLTWAAAVPPDPDADDVAGVMTYEVAVDNNSNFGTPEFSGLTTIAYPDPLQPTITVTTPLAVGVTYYWRVRGRDNQSPTPAAGVWSANQSFRVVANQAPVTPIATFVPADGAVVTDMTPTLSWNNPNPPNPADPNPSDTLATISYEVQVNDTADFSAAPQFAGTTPEGQSSLDVPVPSALSDNTRYYWRVRALDRGGLRSPWTAAQNFWVDAANNNPMPPIDGFVPVIGAGVPTATPRLSWNSGSDTDPGDLPATLRYQVQLSTDKLFATVAYTYSTTVPGSLFVDVTALTETTWYWRVATVDSNGAISSWSTVLRFKVDLTNGVPLPPSTNFNPAGGGNVSDLTPTITFGAGSDPDATDTAATLLYEVELADDNAFPSPTPLGGYNWSGATAVGSTTVTVPGPKSLTTGKTYYWRVRTVDSHIARSVWSSVQSFVVGSNQPPNAANSGFSPTGGADVSDATPTLVWNPATDPDANDTPDVLRYNVIVDDNADFSSPIFNRVTTPGTATIVCAPATALLVGATYYWRVITIDAAGARSALSATQQFRLIKNRAPFMPVGAFAPSGGVEVTTANPTLTWDMPALPDPDSNDTLSTLKYQVQLKDKSDLANAPYTFTVTTGLDALQAVVSANLQDNSQYWWRVRSVDAGGLKSDWTGAHTFWVNLVNQSPAPPDAGFYPANGLQINDSTPTLVWTAATDVDPFDTAPTLHYVVELSTSATFATVSYQYTTADGVVQALAALVLTDNTTWYWRVRTVDGAGAVSVWSAVQNFLLDMNNQPSTLSDPLVTPSYGALGTYFTLQVTYTDAENDPSGKVYCQFDTGQPALEMTKVTPGDVNAVDGIVYQVGIAGTTLGLGAHGHYFYCDGGVRLPNTGYDIGPTIGKSSALFFTNVAGSTVTKYEEGYRIYVKVRDQDQNLDPGLAESVPATVTEAGGDSETITLFETGKDTGDFIGQVQSLGKAGAPNDTFLNAIGGTAGNQLTAIYQDPDDAGNPAPDRRTVNAMLLDTRAPYQVGAVLEVTSGPDGRTVDLDWTAYSEVTSADADSYSQVDVAGYHVYYGTASFTTTAGRTPVATVAAGTQTFQISGLTPNKAYHFAVAAFDEVPKENINVTARLLTTRDTAHPTISGQIPSDEASEVARDTTISFYLDDPGVGVDWKTLNVNVTQSGTPVPCSTAFAFEPDIHHLKVTLTPTAPLNWNALVQVDLDVMDRDGNQLVVNDWNFSTVTDTEVPTLDQQAPAPKATNVAVSTGISFHLKDGKSGIDPASIQATVQTADGTDIAFDLSTSGTPNDLVVLFQPLVELSYSEVYRVTVTAFDVAGNQVGPVTWTFSTVKDASGVVLDQQVPAPNATDVPIDTTIALRLSDAQAGINAATLRLWVQNAEKTNLLTVVQTPDPSTHPTTLLVTYDPAELLPYGTDIPVRVYVEDEVGHHTDVTYKFRTTDAPTYTVSGVIVDPAGNAIAGVTVTAGGKTATTDGTGGYRIVGLLAGTYSVEPTVKPPHAEYDFTPLPRPTVTLGPDDAVDVNFVGTLRTYKVSGRVTLAGKGLAGVAVSCDGQTAPLTKADGVYSFSLPNGQYTVTPQMDNFHFQPTSLGAQVAGKPVPGVDFQAIADQFTISGTVQDNAGNRLQGVKVKAADKAGVQAAVTAITNGAGQYLLTGIKAGDFTLSATKAGYTITRGSYDVAVPPSASDIDFTAMIEMANTFPAGWNLIGLPGKPVDADATKVFGTVECYRYDPEAKPPTYRAPVNDPALEVVRVKAGRGFFVRYARAQSVSVGGMPTDPTRPTSIGLSEGWNMIANPLATPVKWSRFVASQADGIRPFAFVFDTATRSYKMVSNVASVNADRDSLMGWEGAWVRATSGGVSLVLGSSTSASADEVLKPQQVALNGGWTIPVQASAGRLGDFCSVAGLLPGSGLAHVVENPPSAPNAVDLYFTNSAGQRLAHDIRSQGGAQTYDFVVACGVPAVNVTVSLPDLSSVPAGQQIMLIDKDAGKTMYARTMSSYTYHSAVAGAERKFQLVVEPRSAGALVVTSTAALSKGEGVVFTYNVTKGCQVTMRVLNLAGRPVKVLTLNKTVSAGVQTQLWNLTSESGTRVPAGAYLLQIDAVTENGQTVRGLTQIGVGR